MTALAPLDDRVGNAAVEIPVPDDWHVHLRDDAMLATVAPMTARSFRYALVMPNLVPPVCTTAQAAAYRRRVIAAAGDEARRDFLPLMALYLNDDLDADDLEHGFDAGVVFAAKYYPAGATTNSEGGGTALADYRGVIERMAERGIPLLVHAESTDPDVDIYDRERHFLDTQLAPVVEAVPGLRTTVEHLSTAAGADFVAAHEHVRGSVTPHHLACDRSDLLANGLRPDLYCKPIINSPADRAALVAAVTSSSDRFFLGTDSAPHPAADKHGPQAKPGIFNAPFALEVTAEVFYCAGRLDRLAAFASENGCRWYGFDVSPDRLELRRREPSAEVEYQEVLVTAEGDEVTIFGAAEAARWTVAAAPTEPTA